MPRKDIILSLPGFAIKKVRGYNPMVIDVHYRNVPRCAHCNGKKVRKKSSFIRKVRHRPLAIGRLFCASKPIKFIAMSAGVTLTSASLELINTKEPLSACISKFSISTLMVCLSRPYLLILR
jgi:hypothetical protein